jgi:hypothetical protein
MLPTKITKWKVEIGILKMLGYKMETLLNLAKSQLVECKLSIF